jgi:EAL domain-containing protein (putative c-di-GMP-specific phosphodiesterase class I)
MGAEALYQAKADGRGTWRRFSPDMVGSMESQRRLELDLRKALINGEFELRYQTLVNLRTGAICGCEALLRWHHPTRGLISPLQFIPLAEETGLIVPIGEWVMRQACAEATGWPEHMSIAINLSANQFKGRTLVESVISALSQTGLPAQRLELEITESVLLLDDEKALATLRQLRHVGVRIAMDDFGTGHSSFGNLQRFPFDKIKIDRSFVHGLCTNEQSQAIIQAVTAMGRSLGIITTGVGVETLQELEFLKAAGCAEAQGYLFSQPERAGEIQAMLRQEPPAIRAVA